MADFISCTFDTRKLMMAQSIMQEFSRQTPAEGLNRTVLFVLRKTQDNTPFTSTGRIDAELSVEVTPRISTRTGKAVSRKTKNPNLVTAMTGGRSKVENIPFTWLIIGARAKQGSRYNRLTGHRYAMMQHPLKGVPRAGFAQAMAAAVSRMVNARHSSTHFLQSLIGVAIYKILPFVPAGYRGGAGSGPGRKGSPDLAEIEPALGGQLTTACIVELKLGMTGELSALDDKRNQAMHEIIGPILQAAIDSEAEGKMAEAAKRGWLARSSRLAACGVTVNI